MAREGRSRSHESLSYKVHDHPHTRRHTHTYIHHAQCYHTERGSKTDIANVPRVWPSKVQILPYPGNVAQLKSKKR